MNGAEARAFRAAHDTDAKLLSRKPKYELVAIYQSEGGYGGGDWSKDDLIGSILNKRFPIEQLNEATHVLGHEIPGVFWPDCKHCQAVAQMLEASKSPATVPTGTGWPVA